MAVIGKRLSAWLALSRPPFHSVGVLPFVLGGVLAWREAEVFHWDILGWGLSGVVLIMLATYYAGEYWDYREDVISSRQPSRFAGGSGVIQRGLLPRRAALWASLICVALALGVGLVLWLGYRTGPWTMVFGIIGILGGFFYSTRPVRWVSTGVGELWIAFCYGWLPVAVGYYLQVGWIAPLVHWLSVPIGLTIFNVILLNEFPDYQADVAARKRNLTARLGRERAAWLYGLASLGSWVGMGLSLMNGVPARVLWVYVPVLALSVVLTALVVRGSWQDRNTLEKLCGLTIAVNLGTTAAYIFAFLG
jgi:1,4-dihydroxy-2-naphthoate octaprenyltransferase